MTSFYTKYDDILSVLEAVDAHRYAQTRNFTNGAVSRLSPYISRGVLSLPFVARSVIKRSGLWAAHTFIRELAWREYWQRVWEAKGSGIMQDMRKPQEQVVSRQIPRIILAHQTGIQVIDEAIEQLYATGYIHNHLRMYIASLVCNIARCQWRAPADWMYYHLLDGDLASNALSWQWVAGSFSSKKYYCNQENLNKYTGTSQRGTCLDHSYEVLPELEVPGQFSEAGYFDNRCLLPAFDIETDMTCARVLVYNQYQLDPNWRLGETGKRILLLEPDHFRAFPVSGQVLQFIIALSANIQGISVFTGSFDELAKKFPNVQFCFRRHPAFMHYRGIADEPDWLFPDVSGFYPSFSAYWRNCEKSLPVLGKC